ncbi:MAG: hypothetical protein ACRDRN_11950 [Sciscionella sp.]
MATASGHVRRGAAASGVWRVPRSRGAFSGVLLVLLGVWGGLVPFWGPQFGYAYTPDTTWTFTWGRFFLEILPAAAAILGGLGLLSSANRLGGHMAGWLAAAGGLWFVVGPSLSLLWSGDQMPAGQPAAGSVIGRSVAEIGFFYGLGAVILLFAAMAIGRFSVIGAKEAAGPADGHGPLGRADRDGPAEGSAYPPRSGEPGVEHGRPGRPPGDEPTTR